MHVINTTSVRAELPRKCINVYTMPIRTRCVGAHRFVDVVAPPVRAFMLTLYGIHGREWFECTVCVVLTHLCTHDGAFVRRMSRQCEFALLSADAESPRPQRHFDVDDDLKVKLSSWRHTHKLFCVMAP